MKKVYLIFAVTMLLSADCFCQWYNRQYGVTDLNQLSQQQLNEALMMTKDGVAGGALLSVAGAAGIFGGISIVSNAAPGDLESSLNGIGLTGISVIMEITGLLTLFISRSRAISIKKATINIEFKPGVITLPEYTISGGSSGSLPCFSITFNF